MKKEIAYLGIAEIRYTFMDLEVMEALIAQYDIELGHDCEFFMRDGYKGAEPYAHLIVKYKTEDYRMGSRDEGQDGRPD